MEDRLSSDLYAQELAAAERVRGDRLELEVADLKLAISQLQAALRSALPPKKVPLSVRKPELPYIPRVTRRTA
jgi:hypothetical protein